MPYPVAHSLVGIAIGKKTDIPLWLALILTNIPDIDFLLGIFKGNLLIFHDNGVLLAHTPWLAVAAVILFVLISRFKRIHYSTRSIVGVFLLVLSHILLDRYIVPLPYRIDSQHGTHGFFDFLFTYIINPDFLWNNFLDFLFYGSIYILVVRYIFKFPLSPFAKIKKKHRKAF